MVGVEVKNDLMQVARILITISKENCGQGTAAHVHMPKPLLLCG